MNFFIDFEATQFSNGIIAVGCVSEEEDRFYTLVNTKHKITPFITNLTGITAAEVEIAPEPEVVFNGLSSWVQAVSRAAQDTSKPKFYCYGNCDKEFVKTNFKECKDFVAASMLAYLYTDMEDLSKTVKNHFGLCQNIALKKVYSYYIKKDIIQQHNALEDAEMLRVVFDNMSKKDPEFEAFPEYQQAKFNTKINAEVPDIVDKTYTIYRMKNNQIIETYPSLGAAVRWSYEQIPEGEERNKTSLKKIARNIKHAANNPKKKYRNFKWKMIEN